MEVIELNEHDFGRTGHCYCARMQDTGQFFISDCSCAKPDQINYAGKIFVATLM
jgi:hypothetical protein